MTTKRPPRRHEEPTIRLNADGTISRANMEHLALMLADEVPLTDAWRNIGKTNQGGSLQYRHSITGSVVFQSRLATLKAEKEALMADQVFGEIKWMVAQMWREARCTANSTMMQKAAEMRMKILERETALMEREPSLPGKPGKPSVENPQTLAAVDDLKQRLLQAGVPAPGVDTAKTPEKRGISAPSKPAAKSAETPAMFISAASFEDEKVDMPLAPTLDLDAMLARAG